MVGLYYAAIYYDGKKVLDRYVNEKEMDETHKIEGMKMSTEKRWEINFDGFMGRFEKDIKSFKVN